MSEQWHVEPNDSTLVRKKTTLRTELNWSHSLIFLTWHEQERILVREFMSQKLTGISGDIFRTYVLWATPE